MESLISVSEAIVSLVEALLIPGPWSLQILGKAEAGATKLEREETKKTSFDPIPD